jgi:FkbM family methyltransferase
MLNDQTATEAPTEPAIAQVFPEVILWELPVQYCAADCLQPGDTVLDVGGNIGGVAVAFSRLVQNGRVYTFEPNREIWPHLLKTMELNKAANVTHIPLACFSESGKLMRFYSDSTFYKAGSGLINKTEGATSFDVVTVALDDFCRTNSINPSLLKIDVEGAEIHVLRSAHTTIRRCHFPIILEYQTTPTPYHDDPLLFLADLGYVFFDTNTYDQVTAHSYAALPDTPLVNVFCVHKDSPIAARYIAHKKSIVHSCSLAGSNVLRVDDIPLKRGRHIITVSFECPNEANAAVAVCGVTGRLAYYEGPANHLRQHSCSCIVIDLAIAQTVTVEFIKKSESIATLNSITITKVSFPD